MGGQPSLIPSSVGLLWTEMGAPGHEPAVANKARGCVFLGTVWLAEKLIQLP